MPKGEFMSHPIKEIITKRQSGINVGIPSFCTANSIVIEAILEYSKNFNDYILIEATSNQVNQFGGYMNMTPYDFVDYVYDIADEICFPKDKILLGADHFGPLAWADKSESEAMENAKELVKLAVLAGYTKIHLDTSMFLASDDTSKRLSDETIARRGAILYKVGKQIVVLYYTNCFSSWVAPRKSIFRPCKLNLHWTFFCFLQILKLP